MKWSEVPVRAEEAGSQAAIGHRAPKLEVGIRWEILKVTVLEIFRCAEEGGV